MQEKKHLILRRVLPEIATKSVQKREGSYKNFLADLENPWNADSVLKQVNSEANLGLISQAQASDLRNKVAEAKKMLNDLVPGTTKYEYYQDMRKLAL